MERNQEDKRWSFQEEISKLFSASLKSSFPEFEQHPVIFGSQEGQDGDYNCQNVMWIWPKLRKNPELRQKYSDIKEPIDVGETIKKNLPKSSMIDGEASIQDVGFVAISLSRKWFTESIHKMLKDGIDTWAPQLPVKRVLVVDYTPIVVDVGWFQQRAIGDTLVRMLEYSGADVALNINPEISYKISEAPVKFLQYSTSVVTAGIEATTNTRVVIDAENNHTSTLANGGKVVHTYKYLWILTLEKE